MIYAFDTYYKGQEAKTVCIGFKEWEEEAYTFTKSIISSVPDEYVSGQFYKREMPCILELLKEVPLQPEDIIVVDGHVFLDDEGKLGLGGHLYEQLGQTNAIVGVGKSNFASLNQLKREVYRGQSKKPLYITAVGLDLDEVAHQVAQMHGDYRMPDLLRDLDQMTKAL